MLRFFSLEWQTLNCFQVYFGLISVAPKCILKKKMIKRHLLPIFLIVAVSMAIYANTLKNGFVYDDKYIVVNNDFIKDIYNLPKLVSKNYFSLSGELSYRPVVTFTYFFEYALFGLRSWGYHLTNVLLHLVNGVSLYIFLTLLFRGPEFGSQKPIVAGQVPLFASLLFVSHPVLTEAVNAISFREDMLAFFFYNTTLILYLAIRPTPFSHKQLTVYLLYAVSCLIYFLALLSKEMAATLPLIIYFYEWLYGNKKKGLRYILSNPFNLGYLAVTAFYLYLRFYYFYDPSEGEYRPWEITERLLTVPYLVLSYLRLALFPVSLSADYLVMPVKSILSISFFIPAIIVLFLIYAAVVMRQLEKGVTFGIIFFVITLMPVYNIIPIVNPLADRYLYIPAAGCCVAFASAVHHLLKFRSASLLFFAVIGIYSVAVVNRNTVWKDDYLLWSDVVKKVPKNSRPYNDIGNVFYVKGLLNDAIKQYQTAIRLKPDFLEAHYNLGMVYAEKGRFDEAVEEYKIVVRLQPNEPQYRYVLGETYDKQGRFDEAIEELKKALELNPSFTEAHYYLGTVYLKKDLKDDARTEFEMTLKLKPDFLVVRELLGSLNREK